MIPQDQEERRLLIAEYVLGLHRGERAVEIERWLAEDEDAERFARHWRELCRPRQIRTSSLSPWSSSCLRSV